MTTYYPPPSGAPAPPPPAPAKKKGHKKLWALVAVGVVVALIAIGSAAGGGSKKETTSPTSAPVAAQVDDQSPSPSQTAVEVPAAPKPSNAEHAVGDTGTTSKWAVTVNSVTNPFVDSNPYVKAAPGKHFVAVDITMVNTGSKQLTVSSLLMLEVTDASGFRYTESMVTDLPSLGGTVDPDGQARGWAVYQVPDDSTGLVLRVKGDITATGTTFALS